MLKQLFVVVLIDFEHLEWVNFGVSKVATSKAPQQIEICLCQCYVFIICKVVNLSPPLFVGLSFYEFLELVLCFWLDDLLAFYCVAGVVMERVPLLGDVSRPKQHFFVR